MDACVAELEWVHFNTNTSAQVVFQHVLIRNNMAGLSSNNASKADVCWSPVFFLFPADDKYLMEECSWMWLRPFSLWGLHIVCGSSYSGRCFWLGGFHSVIAVQVGEWRQCGRLTASLQPSLSPPTGWLMLPSWPGKSPEASRPWPKEPPLLSTSEFNMPLTYLENVIF